MPKYEMTTFKYTTGFVSLAATAGVTVQAEILIDQLDFAASDITVTVRQGNVVVDNWGGLVYIESQDGPWSNTAIPVDSIAGDGKQPHPLTPPRRCFAGKVLKITFTNNVATATEVCLTLHGNRIHGEVK